VPGRPESAPVRTHRLLGLRASPAARGDGRQRERRPGRSRRVRPAVRGALSDPAHAARRPVRRSDYASIEVDNTSSFNCRNATGSSGWSEHAYGLAIDIDPIENPYVYANGTTSHAAARPFLDRHDVRPGMAEPGGTLVRAFAAVGWGWGGRSPLPTDFQHFSVNGR
jgi:hypothetical protein